MTQRQKITGAHTQALQSLGLPQTQIDLYLTALQKGMLSVLELSKHTGISRQQIYQDAERLADIGLFEVTRKQGRKYIPANPSALIKLARSHVDRAESTLANITTLLPSFEAMTSPKNHGVRVKYYEGMRKIRDAYSDELAAAVDMEVLTFVGSVEDIFQFFPESYWSKWNKQFVAQKSQSRMLVHYSRAAKETITQDAAYNRETRFLHDFPMKVNIDVFGNTVLIVSFYDEMAIWIESDVLSQSYRVLFESLWVSAKKL